MPPTSSGENSILRELEHLREDVRELRQVLGEVREGMGTAVQHAYDHDLDLSNLQRTTREHEEELQGIRHELASAKGTMRAAKWIGGVVGGVVTLALSVLLERLF